MTILSVRSGATAMTVAVLTLSASWAADVTRAAPNPIKSSSVGSQRPSASRTTSTRTVLPDPSLLDGSTQATEKKSDHGMIGDFELPGDENAKTGRVGGGGAQQQNPGQQPSMGAGNLPMGLPSGGGGAEGQPQAGQPSPAQTAHGGGAQDPNAKESGGSGENDPNAKAQGIQVAQLGGESPGNQGAGPAGEKPSAVAIGDSAMRIQTSPNAPGVVGQQQANQNTQVYEKGTGTGGKGPTGSTGANRVEKGRSIPAGL